MLFNAPEFIFLFLPLVAFIYFKLHQKHLNSAAKWWLLVASFFFYGWWKPIYLILIAGSLVFNFIIGSNLLRNSSISSKKSLAMWGVAANVLLLVFYKYADFLLENINWLAGTKLPLLQFSLPLAISFFTFQQIGYLVDCYKGNAPAYTFKEYMLFVTFFPQLIAGPIVLHNEIMPQFANAANNKPQAENIAKGIYTFVLGLLKKIVIADTFAVIASAGYANASELGFLDAWITSLAYAFQLYFDFSGYTDMAIGVGLLFNIALPINFNSPYKSLDIQDFWRRWHITLGRFLRDYIYIPLGGNKNGEFKTLRNLFLTFLIGGIWHGAGWNFIIWGAMHGFALVVHRTWKKSFNLEMPNFLAWTTTFLYVNFAWVFFRATTFTDAVAVLKAMVGMGSGAFATTALLTDIYAVPFLLLGIVALFAKNTNQLREAFEPNQRLLWQTASLVMIALIFLNSVQSSEFLYFDF